MAGATVGGFKDHFSAHASGYAAHRPTYPPELADVLADLAPGTRLALDCGCGTGQLSVALARRFARVIATDASPAQIENAEGHPAVEYRVAPAEASGLPDAVADLVVAAQAAHWFDLPRFYEEARRVARPGGILALVTYGVIEAEPDVDPLIQHFYREVAGPYWPPERRHVEDGYRSLPFPVPDLATPPLAITVSWTAADLAGYVETWSAVRGLERAGGHAAIEAFKQALADRWGDAATRRLVRFPLSLRVGRLED